MIVTRFWVVGTRRNIYYQDSGARDADARSKSEENNRMVRDQECDQEACSHRTVSIHRAVRMLNLSQLLQSLGEHLKSYMRISIRYVMFREIAKQSTSVLRRRRNGESVVEGAVHLQERNEEYECKYDCGSLYDEPDEVDDRAEHVQCKEDRGPEDQCARRRVCLRDGFKAVSRATNTVEVSVLRDDMYE